MKSAKTQQNAQQSAIILLLSTVAVKIISAGFKIPLSSKNFLGDLGFGYFSVAYDLFTPFYTLAISGLPSALSHIIAEFIAQKRFNDIKNTFKITKRLFFVFGLVSSAVIALLAIPFVRLTDNSGNTLYSVYAVIPSIFLCFSASVYRGYFEGFRNMNPTAVSKIIEAFGKLVLGLSFAFLANRLTNNPALAAGASMLGITIGSLVSCGYLYFKYSSSSDLINQVQLLQGEKALSNSKTFKIILSLAIPMAFSSLISSAVSVIDALSVRSILAKDILILLEGYEKSIAAYNSYAASDITAADLPTYLYGLRSKAFTMFNLVPTLTMSLGVGALPVLSACWAKRDINSVKDNLKTVIKMISLIALPSGLGYIAASKGIMALLYSDYGSVNVGGNLLMIFGLTAVFAGFAIPLTSVLQSLNLQLSALVNTVVGVSIKLVLNLLLIGNSRINIYGAAISTTACYLFILVAHLITLFKAVGFVGDIKNIFLKPFFAAIISVAIAFGIMLISGEKIVVVAALISAVAVYILLIFLFKILNKAEILDLPKGEKIYNLVKKLKLV